MIMQTNQTTGTSCQHFHAYKYVLFKLFVILHFGSILNQ